MEPAESGGLARDRQQLPDEAHLRPQPGERVPIDGQEFVWRQYRSPEPEADFNGVLGQVTHRCVVYAVCYLESDRPRNDLALQLSCHDHAKAYLNGRVIYQCRPPRTPGSLDTINPVVLKKGTNVLVFKVVKETGGYEGCARLVDAAGIPAKDISVKLTPE
jgi:hypothetical protein